MSKEDKCITCKLKVDLQLAIDEAEKAQKYYLERAEEANKTIAKYTKKIEELDKEKER